MKAPRGTRDILPEEAAAWRRLEEAARTVADRFGYGEIRTPLFESTDLFVRGVGETTDVVEKQMYTFADRRGRSLTLRPEGTAPVVRAYLERNMAARPAPVKLFYIGPMFRYEKPQAGRSRQFHQFGAEAIGSADPGLDVEMIALPVMILQEAGLSGFEVELNSIGCPVCRPAYRERLLEHLRPKVDAMCRVCVQRLERNPLRVLDCKEEGCRNAAAEAPLAVDFLCAECEAALGSVKEGLADIGIPYVLNGRLVRGLDYYTRTVFEVRSSALGAQDALAGGGRYDGLVEAYGGPSTPAVGFAAGMERVLLALEETGAGKAAPAGLDVFVVSASEPLRRRVRSLAHRLRTAGRSVELDYEGRSLKGQMKAAARSGAAFVVIVGEAELEKGAVGVRRMADGAQEEVPLDQLEDWLERRLSIIDVRPIG